MVAAIRRRVLDRARRARHNDFDYACVNWWGDRHPAPKDRRNRDFGGDPSALNDRRCLVCRPYGIAEADGLLSCVLTLPGDGAGEGSDGVQTREAAAHL